jgi:hypothetical protein
VAQEAVAQAKAVGGAEVAIAVALHQAGLRASPPATSVGAAARWGHWACECRSMSKKEQTHVAQDEEEASLMLTLLNLICPEVIFIQC